MTTLLNMYRQGAITADHLAVESLHQIDPVHPELVLGELPDEVLARIQSFADHYRPQGMVTNYGLLPAVDQVAAAKRWIEQALQSRSRPARGLAERSQHA